MSNENNKQKNTAIFRKTAVAVTAAALLASMTLMITSCGDTEVEETTIAYTTPVPVTEATTIETEPPLVLTPEAEERLAVCKDSAGWISINGVVDEEFLQTDNNNFYLDRGPDGEKREGGTIYADFRNVLAGKDASDNIVLYGHNQKNGTRFGQLDFYKWNKEYYKTNPVITLRTNYEEAQYKIFAIFITSVLPEHDNGNVFDYHNYIDFNDEARYNEFVENCKKRSTIIPDVDVEYGDKFLTLSTCSTEFDPSRLVIVARKVREGESAEVDMTNFKINPNPLYPQIYYDIAGGSYQE